MRNREAAGDSLLPRAAVNLFRGSTDTRPVKVLALAQVLDAIQDGTYQRPIQRLRDLFQAGDKAGYDRGKRRLDALTFGGTFSPTRAKANLTLHSGIIHGDLDHLTDLQAAKHTLTADPHVVYCFVSPSGAGLKVGVASDPVADDGGYKAAWQTIADAHQRDYGLMWDRSGKDISRLCYVSWDPDLYRNPGAHLFDGPAPAPTPERPPAPRRVLFDVPHDRRARYAQRALDTAVDIIDRSILGNRHEHRLRGSELLGGYIAGGLLSYDEAWGALAQAVARNTDDLDRSLKTIADGLRHGQERPISLEELEAERRDWIERHRPSRTGDRINSSKRDIQAEESPPRGDDGDAADLLARVEADPPRKDQSDDIHLTEVGNGIRLVRRFGRDLRYVAKWKKWLTWQDGRWALDDQGTVERYGKQVVAGLYEWAKDLLDTLASERMTAGGASMIDPLAEPDLATKTRQEQVDKLQTVLKWALKSEAARQIHAMIDMAHSESGIPIDYEALDADPCLLNLENGTLDLRTCQVRPPRREDLLTKRAPVCYDAAATCPKWEGFLWRIMGGPKADEEGHETALLERHERAERLIGYLQRAVGYSLTGSVQAQAMWFLHGGGQNGKSTFLNIVLALLGEYGMQAVPEMLLVRTHDPHLTERADLFGKRLVATVEVEAGKRLAESLSKMLTGGEKVRARRMREDSWEFEPTWKFWLAANYKPVIRGTDWAMWRRIKLVPFTVTIPSNEQDEKLLDKLKVELPGILNWAIEGCRAWQKDGLQEPPEVTAASQAYRHEMDSIGQFLDECCWLKPDNPSIRTQSSVLHQAFENYASEKTTQKEFTERLIAAGHTKKVGGDGRVYWLGIGLIAPERGDARGSTEG